MESVKKQDDIRVRSYRFMSDALFNAAVLAGLKGIISSTAKDANNDETKGMLEKAVEYIDDAIEAINGAVTANNKELAKVKPGDIQNA